MADNRLSTFLPDDKAAFGVFPQMKPRRRLQDPEAAANVPLSVLRGYAAGTAGLPGDIEGLARAGFSQLPPQLLTAFPALRAFGIGSRADPTPQLPTTEFYNDYLPGASLNETPTGKAFTTAGNLLGGVGSTNIAGLGVKGATAGVKALGPTAVRMGEGYLQRQGLMLGVVPEAPVPPATPLASMIEKPQAPVSELGFYSATEQAALNLPRKSGTGESFLNDLMKGQDVKKDELSWLGLDDYLKGKPNVTRQEVQDFIAGNRVDVQEMQLGGILSPELQVTRDALNNKYKVLVDNIANAKSQFEEGKISYAELRNTVSTNKVQTEALDSQINEINKTITPTKYQQYQLPGGKNYREIFLTLPKQSLTTNDIATRLFGKEMRFLSEAEKDAVVVEARRIESTTPKDFAAPHFDKPNILAHMRVNDRVDADGKKMLLIEEIQSDWHQAGKEKGYNTPEKKAAEQEKLNSILTERQNLVEEQKRLEELALPYASRGKDAPSQIVDRWSTISNRLQNLQTEQNRLGRTTGDSVPDAPFKDTWHQLALKRALKYAADNGYERVGLTTGRQQVDRYTNQIRQNVDEIQFQTGRNLSDIENTEFKALGQKAGMDMTATERARYSDLSELAEEYVGLNETKIRAFKNNQSTFQGTVKDGKFLDGPAQGKTVEEVLGKSMAKKIAEKQFGSIKGDNLTIGGEGMKVYYDEIYPAFFAKQGKKYNAKTGETNLETKKSINSVRYIDISPEMRSGVKKGQPLFTAAPIGGIGLGAGTQDQQQNSINSFIQ